MGDVRLRARALAWGPAARAIGTGLDFALEDGRAIALMGPNGSGKTSLLRTLLGRLAPIEGTVELDGRPVAQWPRRVFAQHLGYVAQQSSPVPGYRALDWVLLARTARLAPGAAPGRSDLAAAGAALASLGVGGLAEAPLDAMSGGERRLVSIARALAQGARVLLLDEPCASLDFANRARVLSALAALRRGGHALVVATHAPFEAKVLAQQVVLLGKGGAAQLLPVADALEPARLAAAFGVEPALIEASGGEMLE